VDALIALVPSVGVGLLFWLALRAMVNGDRREREALARMEREERRKAAGVDTAPAVAADERGGEQRPDRA
jgi:hypothetical protein